jgi:uncharacterized damage-inducible protein DinB
VNKSDIEFLYQFNDWANALTLNAADALTPEQFNQKQGSSFSSVRDTLAHIFGAEWIWLERWKGVSPKSLADHLDLSSMAAFRREWAVVEQERTELISRLNDEALNKIIAYTNTKGEEWSYSLGLMMQHLVNHSSYHRGQVTTMLRQLGAGAVSTDLLIYVDQQSAR